ncbi:MAG: hypothetical protein MUO94_05485, partial [Thermoplasmata archaeon]|nr:hypothetical protein [Thermoplasmata archaeon]
MVNPWRPEQLGIGGHTTATRPEVWTMSPGGMKDAPGTISSASTLSVVAMHPAATSRQTLASSQP